MLRLNPALFIVCTIALGSNVGRAQAPSIAIAGRWAGAFDTMHADGSVDREDAFFSFSQQGETVTGTAGESPEKQSPIATGTIRGDTLTFETLAGGETRVKFRLSLDGDRLRGSAVGLPVEAGSTVLIDVMRADESWRTRSPAIHAQDQLFDRIAELDRKLFDAYNACDLSTMAAFVTDDLEFYHDKTGLAIGRKVFLDSIQNNICGKVRRTLAPGTLEVHRLSQYGAVEIGVHRFDHPGNEGEGVGEAKFIHIWRFKDGEWRISRVISYDHGVAKERP